MRKEILEPGDETISSNPWTSSKALYLVNKSYFAAIFDALDENRRLQTLFLLS